MRVAVFSGRFDPPNLGHILTMNKIIQEYDYLVAPILDYSHREGCSAKQAQKIFNYYYQSLPSRKAIFPINKIHFGEIKDFEILIFLRSVGLPGDYIPIEQPITYLSGNREVLKHIKSLGIKTKYVPRVTIPGIDQYLFESTKIRETMKKEHKTLSQIYNVKLSA